MHAWQQTLGDAWRARRRRRWLKRKRRMLTDIGCGCWILTDEQIERALAIFEERFCLPADPVSLADRATRTAFIRIALDLHTPVDPEWLN